MTQSLDLQNLTSPPRGVKGVQSRSQRWAEVDVTTSEIRCAGGEVAIVGAGEQSGTRLVILLEAVGGRIEPRVHLHERCTAPAVNNHISLYPASDRVWGYSHKLSRFKTVSMRFELERVREQMREELLLSSTFATDLRFCDENLWQLGRMLSDQVDGIRPDSELYCESLLTTLFTRLATRQSTHRHGKQPRLTPRQLRIVIEFLACHEAENVSISTLADLVGLSCGSFCRAFRASTGMPPHQWQLDARVRRAQALMIERGSALADVALVTGFSDQSHFTRVFRRFTGLTPSMWLRERGSGPSPT